jgi:hypothetical protein
MSSFHSGTDVGDEAQMYGIHITFGDMDIKEQFSLDPEVVVNGTRFPLSLDYMSGVIQVTKGSEPKFYRIIQHPKYTITCPELKDWKTPDE